jgi:hypothetical protein
MYCPLLELATPQQLEEGAKTGENDEASQELPPFVEYLGAACVLLELVKTNKYCPSSDILQLGFIVTEVNKFRPLAFCAIDCITGPIGPVNLRLRLDIELNVDNI